MMAGCYTLELYCDNEDLDRKGLVDKFGHEYDEFPHRFIHELGSVCRRKARKAGWIIGRRPDGKDLCPKCSGKVKRAA